MKKYVIFSFGLLLASCGNGSINAAKEAVTRELNDPGSAQFRDVRVAGGGDTVCGEVNSKNRYGGYVGFRRFAYDVATTRVTFDVVDDADADRPDAASQRLSYRMRSSACRV